MTIDLILDRAIRGERLGLEDGIRLYESTELEKIGWAANKVMEKWHPEPMTTFVIGRNVNYSNICDTYCRFCAFYRPLGHTDGYVLSDDSILQKIQEMVDVSGTELLMQGGTHPELGLDYYVALLKKIKGRFPHVQIHSLSVAEIVKIAENAQLPVKQVLEELHAAGLDSLPGAGAEILDDRTRVKISQRKGSWTEWIDGMKLANQVGLPTTATMVIGFGESYEERVQHFLRVREAQDETNGFTAFISWTFQPENTRLKAKKVSPEEYLQNVAISRLMVDNIANFQSSWVTMGPEVGKKSLRFGCNDFGSTMMEENVVSAAECTFKVNTNQIIQLIREAGKTPAQRNTKYEILRVFEENQWAETDFVMQN